MLLKMLSMLLTMALHEPRPSRQLKTYGQPLLGEVHALGFFNLEKQGFKCYPLNWTFEFYPESSMTSGERWRILMEMLPICRVYHAVLGASLVLTRTFQRRVIIISQLPGWQKRNKGTEESLSLCHILLAAADSVQQGHLLKGTINPILFIFIYWSNT